MLLVYFTICVGITVGSQEGHSDGASSWVTHWLLLSTLADTGDELLFVVLCRYTCMTSLRLTVVEIVVFWIVENRKHAHLVAVVDISILLFMNVNAICDNFLLFMDMISVIITLVYLWLSIFFPFLSVGLINGLRCWVESD